MSIVAAELIARIAVEGAEGAASQLLGMGVTADEVGARFKMLAVAGVGVLVGGLIAVGAKSAEMAGNFQAAVTRLYTTAGESKKNLDMVGQGVLSMSTQVGTGAQKLVEALYFVESAGFHGKAGLDVLRIAAMGAKAENADMIPVVKTLVSTLNAYTGTGLTAAGAMNTLIAAVSQGHMTLNDLAGAVSNILPATSRFHISLIDTTGAIAEMTKQGDNASSAATHLRQMILALEAPSKIGAASMKLVGLSSQELSDEMRKSLPGAIQMVTDAVGKKFPEGSAAYNQAIKNIAGGSKQMMGFLELSGKHTKDFADIVKTMTGNVHDGGNSIMGWAAVQDNFNFKMDKAKAVVEAFMIRIGSALLPILSKILDTVTPVISAFSDWATSGHAVSDMIAFFNDHANVLIPILAGVGAIILAVLVPAVIGLAGAVWGLAAGVIAATWPFLALGAAVGILVAIFRHWYDTNAGFKIVIDNLVRGFQQVAGVVISNFMPTLKALIGWVTGTMIPALQNLGNWLFVHLGAAFNQLGTIITNAKNAIGGFFSALGTDANNAKNAIGGFFSAVGTVAHNVLVIFQNFVSWLKSVFMPDFKDASGAVGPLKDAFAGVWAALQNLWKSLQPVGDSFNQLGTAMRQLGAFIAAQYGPAFSQLGTVMNQLGKAVLPALKVAWDSIWNAIKPILPQLELLAKIIGGIIVANIVLLISFLAGLVMAFAQVLVGVIKVFTGIVTTISGAIQVTIGIVTFFIDLLTGRFGKLGADLAVIWNGIKTMFGGVWLIIQGIFQASIGALASLLGTFAHTAITIFQGLFNTLVGHSIIPDMVNAIIAWFASLPGRALSALGGLAGMMAGFFGGLAGRAFSWGANIIANLASGIIGGIWSSLSGAMNAIGGFISSHLPSSPAKMGPLRDLALQGSKIPEQIAQGMVSGMPKLQTSLNMMLTPHSMTPLMSGGASGGHQIVVQQPDIYLDGVRLSRGLMPHIASAIRYNTGGFGR